MATPSMAVESRGERLVALDALRGFVMVALAWGLLARAGLLANPGSRAFALQFHHVDWEGLRFWDLIQPGFWMVIGAALPFALARRRKQGASFAQNLRHAAARAVRLALIGQALMCIYYGRYVFHPRETLTQIAVCYFLCFLILQAPFRGQVAAAAALMLVNWGVYQLFPGAAGPYSPADNIGVKIDRAVFGIDSAGRWVTIYFLGSTVTMLFGAWTGSLILGARPAVQKLKLLALATAACFAVAVALAPFNPVMQKTWTASFTFFGTGWVLLALLALFWLLDLKGCRRPAFPLAVVGMNCIFFYVLSQGLGSWLDKAVGVFTGRFQFAGGWAPALQAGAVVLVLWYVAYWLYRRKIFLKA